MRRIREARSLTLDDLHDETKIPIGLIEAFEDRALFDHPQFNRVYLRSFVRTYAQVVGIDADVALEGLEEALAGRYSGALAVAYLGEDPEPILPPSPDAGDEPEEAGASDAPPYGDVLSAEGSARPAGPEQRGDAGDPAGQRMEQPGKEQPGRERPAEEQRRENGPGGDRPDEDRPVEDRSEAPADSSRASFVSTTQSTAAGYRHARAGEEEGAADNDWTAQSPPSVDRRPPRAGRAEASGGVDRRWVIGGALAAAIALLVWFLVTATGGPDEPHPVASAAEDTSVVVRPTDVTLAAPAAQRVDVPSLGDTMNVRIVATEGKVDPIRVTVDDDLRRPYWIEYGDSMAFQLTERIVIEELLDSVTVKIEGLEYPTARRDTQGRLVITRDTAESYFTSLRDDL